MLRGVLGVVGDYDIGGSLCTCVFMYRVLPWECPREWYEEGGVYVR